jgi:hypothetical protein
MRASTEELEALHAWCRAKGVTALRLTAAGDVEMVLGPAPPPAVEMQEESEEERAKRLKREEDELLFASS